MNSGDLTMEVSDFNPQPQPEVVTAEDRARIYAAAMDSVAIITDPEEDPEKTAEERKGDLERNIKHLELIIAKPFWESEDLTPFSQAITAGKAELRA